MKEQFKSFGQNFKFYIDHILKLDFGELMIRFIELLIVIILALIMYIPISLIQDFIYTILGLLGNYSKYINIIINIIFKLIGLIVCVISFVYFFNKRYEDLKKDIKNKEENIRHEKTKEAVSELDLPKTKED